MLVDRGVVMGKQNHDILVIKHTLVDYGSCYKAIETRLRGIMNLLRTLNRGVVESNEAVNFKITVDLVKATV